MSAETILEFLSGCSLEAELGFRVAAHCAPVLKNVKVSNIMSVKRGTWRKIWRTFQGSPVQCVPIYVDLDKEVLLLYRPRQLEAHLRKRENREFLERYGYEEVSVSGVIDRLRVRYKRFAREKKEFPHELGVILEYPVEDVEGFICHGGRNCLMEKYWKVYHNLEGARAAFDRYDQAREEAMAEIIAGYPLQRVTVS